MGRVIFVTAFKGGVGKTTAAAGIAAALASLGKRVCIVDADFGMRCMDLVLGLENSVLFDCGDVLAGRCSLEDALMRVDESGNLRFASIRANCDYCIVDSSAELTDYYRSFAREADEAVVVSLHQSTSIRAAEKTAANLAAIGYRRVRLLVNGYRYRFAAEGRLPTVLEVIRRSSVPLLGGDPRVGMPACGPGKRRNAVRREGTPAAETV